MIVVGACDSRDGGVERELPHVAWLQARMSRFVCMKIRLA